MNKKGAIEFSMTTIMIIIIGVAVLALSLAWVRGTFRQIGGLTDESIAAAEMVVSELGATGKIGVPSTLILKPNEVKKFQIAVRNDVGSSKTFGIPSNGLTFAGTGTEGCFVTKLVSTSGLDIAPGGSEKFIAAVGATGTSCPNEYSNVIKVTVNKDFGVGATLYGEEGITVIIRK